MIGSLQAAQTYYYAANCVTNQADLALGIFTADEVLADLELSVFTANVNYGDLKLDIDHVLRADLELAIRSDQNMRD